jgi:hypothetical protein
MRRVLAARLINASQNDASMVRSILRSLSMTVTGTSRSMVAIKAITRWNQRPPAYANRQAWRRQVRLRGSLAMQTIERASPASQRVSMVKRASRRRAGVDTPTPLVVRSCKETPAILDASDLLRPTSDRWLQSSYRSRLSRPARARRWPGNAGA